MIHRDIVLFLLLFDLMYWNRLGVWVVRVILLILLLFFFLLYIVVLLRRGWLTFLGDELNVTVEYLANDGKQDRLVFT